MIEKSLRGIISYLVKHRCREENELSEKDSSKTDCYSVFLFDRGYPFLEIHEIDNKKVSGLKWDGSEFSEPHELSVSELSDYTIKIKHKYKIYITEYNSLMDFILSGMTKVDILKINMYRTLGETDRFKFSRRRLATLDTVEVLRAIINDHVIRNRGKFSVYDLMTTVYSSQWIVYKDKEEHERRKLILDSLVETGEIEEINTEEYRIRGKAIATLCQYEEQERRHAENIRLQILIACFTGIIALAEIIRLLN